MYIIKGIYILYTYIQYVPNHLFMSRYLIRDQFEIKPL